jgi:putative transposase
LSGEQKARLKEMIDKRDDWTTDEVRKLIRSEFGVEYTLKQVRVILRRMGAKYGKPLQHDYRRPKDAEEIQNNAPFGCSMSPAGSCQ